MRVLIRNREYLRSRLKSEAITRDIKGKTEVFNQKIVDEYLAGQNTYDISKKYKTSPPRVNRLLRNQGVKIRSSHESAYIKFANHTKLSKNTLSMVNGWLLGDGSLWHTGRQAYFCLTTKHEEYAKYVRSIMIEEGLHKTRINKVYNKLQDKKFVAYKVFSESTVQFADLYGLWYSAGKKTVPDIELDSYLMKRWIMDDGTVSKQKGHLRLCTCSFSVEECEILSEKLNTFLNDSRASWVIEKKKHPRIYVPKQFTRKLFDKIGLCDVCCFQYKWQNSFDATACKEILC